MAIDTCEPQIVRALEKDGWEVKDKPFVLRGDSGAIFAEFSVRRGFGELVEEIIVVEVKCFGNPQKDQPEFYAAVGQYEAYRAALIALDIDMPLYLAVPQDAYNRLLQKPFVAETLRQNAIQVLVVDLVEEVITAWIS
jgi:hypothetical protein